MQVPHTLALADPGQLLSKLILGTVQLGIPYGINNAVGQPSSDESFVILRHAHSAGIRTLDTADAYGTATECIGEFHAKMAQEQAQKPVVTEHSQPLAHRTSLDEKPFNEEPFNIITKFHADSATNLHEQVRSTCSRLNVPSLYCYQYHRFSDVAAFPHLKRELLALKEEGIIKHIGVSIYTNDEFRVAIDTQAIDVIQLPFNCLDNMQFRGDLMRSAKDAGKQLHTRSVFLQGLFFKNPQMFPPNLASLAPAVERLQNLAESRNLGSDSSVATLALNYVLHNPLVDAVLFGVETIGQLSHTLASVQMSFDGALRDEVERIIVAEPRLLNPAHWNM